MTPTIEDVERVADTVGALRFENYSETNFTDSQLQAFAQHYIEVGRKMQREKDAAICDEEAELANLQARNGGRAIDDGRVTGAEACAEAIRNNTGE